MALSTRRGVRSVQRASKNLQKETGKAPFPHDQGNPVAFRHAEDGVDSCCRREPITCRADPRGHRAPVDIQHARAGRRERLRLGLDRAGRYGRGRRHRGRALLALTAALTATASRTPATVPAAPSASSASSAAASRAPAGETPTTTATAAPGRTGARADRGRRARAPTATTAARRGPAASATTGRSPAGPLAFPVHARAVTGGRSAGGTGGPARVQGTRAQAADEQHVGRDAHAPAHGARGPRRRHPSPPFPLADGDPCRNGLS